MEEQKPTRDQREIVECHWKTWCRGASSRRRLGLPHPFLPLLQHLPLCSDRSLACLSRRRAVACPNSPCTAALQSRTPEALVSFLVLKPTELFLAPGPLSLLCSLLVPRRPLAPSSFSSAFRSWRPLCRLHLSKAGYITALHHTCIISFIAPTQSRIILLINYVLAYCLSPVGWGTYEFCGDRNICSIDLLMFVTQNSVPDA